VDPRPRPVKRSTWEAQLQRLTARRLVVRVRRGELRAAGEFFA
jgi:hypothetical protein